MATVAKAMLDSEAVKPLSLPSGQTRRAACG
jgi:hypothetical protein